MKKSLPINHAPMHRVLKFVEHVLLDDSIRAYIGGGSAKDLGIDSGFLRARSHYELQSMAKAIVTEFHDCDSVEYLLRVGMLLGEHRLTFTDSDFLAHHDFNSAWWLLYRAVDVIV